MEPPPAKRRCGGASGEQPEPGPGPGAAATAASASPAVETLLDLSARRVAETWAFEQVRGSAGKEAEAGSSSGWAGGIQCAGL